MPKIPTEITSGLPSQEPSAVALKAAYRLLKAMNNMPGLPLLDALALILDRELRYSDAIDLISEAEVYFRGPGNKSSAADVFKAFEVWARS